MIEVCLVLVLSATALQVLLSGVENSTKSGSIQGSTCSERERCDVSNIAAEVSPAVGLESLLAALGRGRQLPDDLRRGA